MKFLKKILALSLAMVFLIALIIGAGIILSVQNVNVRFVHYGDGEYSADYERTRANLNELKGTGLLFLSSEDIEAKIANSDTLALESYTKVYPCSIDVVIRERRETFAVTTQQGEPSYDVYDECGVFMKSSSTIDGSDGSANVLVSGFTSEEMTLVAQVGGYFKQTFSSFRRIVKQVSSVTVAGNKAMKFTLRSGFVIRIYSYDGGNNELKLSKAYEKYSTLTDLQKLDGVIDVVCRDGGEPFVIYPGYDGI